MRSFASDNNSGVHPLILNAIIDANDNHAKGYGDDPWSELAKTKICEVFGENAAPFFVFNGTGANSVALQAVTRPFNSIICAETAHIYVDECGAPAKMTGSAVISISTENGKLTPELIKPHLTNFGVCHHSQPKVVYISQATELGTIYTPSQIREIANLIHSHGMYLHVDGARVANACAHLGCTLKEITSDCGVDILSFGGTKNGMMMGEAVISFRDEITENIEFIRKQSAQLSSKLRYLSAQFLPYLENNLWLDNAINANQKAEKLAIALSSFEQINFTQKIESNQLFFTLPQHIIDKLQQHYYFYVWNESKNEVRLVTSWDTTDQDISNFVDTLSNILS